MVTLRDYQVTAADRVLADLNKNCILVIPTGGGKTVVAVEIVRRVGQPVLWLAHRKELIDQSDAHLQAHGLRTGIIMAGYAPPAGGSKY